MSELDNGQVIRGKDKTQWAGVDRPFGGASQGELKLNDTDVHTFRVRAQWTP